MYEIFEQLLQSYGITAYKYGKQTYCYFTCYGYSKGKCLAKNSISSLKLEPAVMESIKDVLNTGNISFRYVEPKQEAKTDLSGIIQEQMKRNTERMSRIKEAYQNGVDTLEEYKANKKMLQKEMELLKTQLQESIDNETDHQEDHENRLLERVRNVYEIIDSDSVDLVTKNEILKSVVEKIVYDRSKDELKVYYYYKAQPQ